MTNESSAEAPPFNEGGALCSRCKKNPRCRKNSSWCISCINAQAAIYRARTRPRPTTEERTCGLDGCEEIFTWRSRYPKQECCSQAHYMKKRWRDEHPLTEVEVLAAGEKRCPKCGSIKSVHEFSPSVREKAGGQCRSCMRAYDKRWREGQPEARSRTSAASRRSRAARLLRKYGAPSEDLQELIRQQGGLCACCGEVPKPSVKLVEGFVIDHDHQTIKYRGLLCGNCNTRLHDGIDLDWVLKAIAYLDLDRMS